jgi:hypothetical protein
LGASVRFAGLLAEETPRTLPNKEVIS